VANVKWRLIELEVLHPPLLGEDCPFLPLSYLPIPPLSLSLSRYPLPTYSVPQTPLLASQPTRYKVGWVYPVTVPREGIRKEAFVLTGPRQENVCYAAADQPTAGGGGMRGRLRIFRICVSRAAAASAGRSGSLVARWRALRR
jgi:hypothetical protein